MCNSGDVMWYFNRYNRATVLHDTGESASVAAPSYHHHYAVTILLVLVLTIHTILYSCMDLYDYDV